MAHALLFDRAPTYSRTHLLMTQVTASAHQSEKGTFGGVVRRRTGFTATRCSCSSKGERGELLHPKRGRDEGEVGDEGARVFVVQVQMCLRQRTRTDVSIANFHLAFPPSLPPWVSLPVSPSPPLLLDRSGCRGCGEAIIHRRAASFISAAWRLRAGKVTVVVWSQSRLLLSTSKDGVLRVCDQVSTPLQGTWACMGGQSYSA